MAEDLFHSTDSVRGCGALPHAKSVTFDGPLKLARGGELPQVTVAYETYGWLNAARDNAVLICHALSGDSHVAKHDECDDPGWWDVAVGPGKPIDTDRYFVICPNVLGGCRGSTGPNTLNPATGKPFGSDFPLITVDDIMAAQRLLIDHLGIDRLRAVIGGSLGGQMALTWATRHPDRVAGIALIATAPRLTSQALAFDVIGRNAILRDPNYRDGQYYSEGPKPDVGLAIARMLGHITYLSREAMTQKFDPDRLRAREIRTQFETKFSVGSYLAYQGDKFVERFDANSYLTLSMALDLFDFGATREELIRNFQSAECRWLVVSFTSDWLFPPFQSRQMVDALVALNQPVSYCDVKSDCGHDAFLLPDELEIYGGMLTAFLANLEEDDSALAESGAGSADDSWQVGAGPREASHFRRADGRLDYHTMLELIEPGASVLDLGCGRGGLLRELKRRGHQRLIGVELDELEIVECVRRGLDVIQADLNRGLEVFADGQFDYVILSRTLQTVMDVERVLNEMLRVGRQGIVSFPNLGYAPLRRQLAEEGRAPSVEADEGFAWYNTPNVRFFTIADFETLCDEQGMRIHQRIALNTGTGKRIIEDPNSNADLAIMVLSH